MTPGPRNLSQNRKLWGLVSRLAKEEGMDRAHAEDIMREHCVELSGQEHTSKLTAEQADRLIDALSSHLSSDPSRPVAPDPSALIAAQQQAALSHLYEDAGIVKPMGFNLRIIKKPWPQTRAEASKLHQALSAMILRQVTIEQIIDMVVTLGGPIFGSRLNGWERAFIEDLKKKIGAGRKLSAGTVGKLREIRAKVIDGRGAPGRKGRQNGA